MNERKEAMKAAVQATSGASQTGLRSPEQGADIIERLRAVGCDREPFTPAHSHCICRTTYPASNEIERLRSVNDDLVAALEAFLNAATFDDLSSSHDAARAALLKAKGGA